MEREVIAYSHFPHGDDSYSISTSHFEPPDSQGHCFETVVYLNDVNILERSHYTSPTEALVGHTIAVDKIADYIGQVVYGKRLFVFQDTTPRLSWWQRKLIDLIPDPVSLLQRILQHLLPPTMASLETTQQLPHQIIEKLDAYEAELADLTPIIQQFPQEPS